MPDNSSTRTPLVIDGDLRTITVPTDYVFGVYNDKDVLAVPFVCPRYMDDIDLSGLSIRINFTNSTGTSSYYDVPTADKTINTDTIEFTWLLGSAVFTGSGKVTFSVCLRNVEENGLITREFNTTLASAKVLEGLEVENQNDPAQYSILTALQSIADSVNSSIESADEYAEQLKNYVGSPLVANTSTDMVDVSRIYVYTGNETGYSNGHWYYYNNAAWHDGGNYNAVANGIYPDLTAGNVLLGRTQSDSAPYLLRKTGNRLNKVGYSCYETIVGASVGWNQQIYAGDFSVTDAWATLAGTTMTISGNECVMEITANYGGIQTKANGVEVAKRPRIIEGHKYFISATLKASNSRSNSVGFGLSDYASQYPIRKTFSVGTAYSEYVFIGNASATVEQENVRFMLFDTKGATSNFTLSAKAMMVVDLTALLGSSIADYIYSLETSTAGSGIAKLREWGFCNGYAEYDAGSIESVEVTDKVVRGFNQWDEEVESGIINPTTGEAQANSNVIRAKNYINCLPNTTYYVKSPSPMNICFYDANKSFISGLNGATSNVERTTPVNCYYIRFSIGSVYGTTYNNDICINLSSDRNGEYEPYTMQSYSFADLTLRGVPKLTDGKLYYDGDTYEADGTVTRKYGVVDLGSLYWTYANGRFTAAGIDNPSITDAKQYGNTVIANVICAVYTTASRESLADKQLSMHYSGQNYINVMDSGYSDASTFKTAMSGVYLVYELATPTTETSTPFTSPQVCYPDGTEEFITETPVPVGHSTDYPYDMKSISEKLVDIPDVPSTNGTYVLKATRTASGLTYTWVTG